MEFNLLKHEIRSKLREDKTAYILEQCKEVELESRKGCARGVFQKVSEVTKQVCPSAQTLKASNGAILTAKEDIQKRWVEYCENLYKEEVSDGDAADLLMADDTSQTEMKQFTLQHEPLPTREEVQRAIDALNCGKASGPDEIPAELLKLGGAKVVDIMHKICTRIWLTGEWPTDWTHSTFVPLHKKGDNKVCSN
ncbi:hypothetical protein, partial [Rhodococcus sp. NKCM2511]|uniref:hypothetical protein n=1 Tax=Rhodococcus sp. NKCM2511 TaxID=2766011 RepID=UPI001910473F